MNILWLTWKDHTHPQAGGAEIVLRELSKRLVGEGHEVTFLTVRHPGSAPAERIDGINIIRVGSNRYMHPLQALAYFMRKMRGAYDVVIEVVNTAPYFGVFFGGKAKTFLFYHQLAREIWFYETKAPLSHLGYYLLEPFATRLLARSKAPVITVSDSTIIDLGRYGFRRKPAHIISEGIEIPAATDLGGLRKFKHPTMLSHGAVRAMKRTLDQVKAFEAAKQTIPDLKLIISGDISGDYGDRVQAYIKDSPFARDISVEGRVSLPRKIELMQRVHIITVTSVKEGWGLIVTEAASQGTPAVVYDVDGLRDSVRHERTGLVCEPNPLALANNVARLIKDSSLYQKLRSSGWEWSKDINFDRSYKDFKQIMEANL